MPTEKPRQKRSPDLDRAAALAREALTCPRALTAQILDFLVAHHEVTGDDVIAWLRNHLKELESYELDLLLSPLFTPDFATRVRFEEALGDGSIETARVEALIQELVRDELAMVLLHAGERIEMPVPEVMIERLVRMLHLDAPVPEEAFGPLDPEVRACLRDKVWRRPQSRELLAALLAAARTLGEAEGLGDDFPDYVCFLTDFVRSHRPASIEDCLKFLDNLAEAYEKDLRKHESGSRSFFNDELKASYAGRRKVDDDIVTTHKRMISMAKALRKALG